MRVPAGPTDWSWRRRAPWEVPRRRPITRRHTTGPATPSWPVTAWDSDLSERKDALGVHRQLLYGWPNLVEEVLRGASVGYRPFVTGTRRANRTRRGLESE